MAIIQRPMLALSSSRLLDDQGAGIVSVGAYAVEGEDEGVAELVDVVAEPQSGGARQIGAGDELRRDGFAAGRYGTESAGDGAVGADEHVGVVEPERTQDVQGVGVAAAGGDDDLDAGRVGRVEGR